LRQKGAELLIFSMLETLNKIKEGILDILLPKKCIGCKKEGQYICKNCEIFLSEVEPYEAELTPGVVSVWEYEGIIEKAILKIKYNGCHDIINELVDKAFEKIELNLSADTYITYVPMYKKRERERGFNQAELTARKVGEKTERPVIKFLKKIKDNRTQVGLDPKERLENVKDAFQLSVKPSLTETPSSVLLVDDVYTTGATMRECTRVLRKAGVKNVYGFTIARKLKI